MYTHIAHKTVYKRLSCETLYFLTGCKVTIFLNYNRIDIHYKFRYQILNELLCLKKSIKYLCPYLVYYHFKTHIHYL